MSNKILIGDGRAKKFYVLAGCHDEVGATEVISPLNPRRPGASSGRSTTVSDFI